jgi:hypothetical protein
MGLCLALLAGCTVAPPKLSATVGTYVLKQGNQTKTGFALFSTFDPARRVPSQGFDIKVSGPNSTQITRTYPGGRISDWFANPDQAVSSGPYTVRATVDGQSFSFQPILDISNSIAPPEPQLSAGVKKPVSVEWKAVTGARVYYVTLNRLVSGKPENLAGEYTEKPNRAFAQGLTPGETYFVAVGALNLDPRIGYASLSNQPFNASYGQTRTFTVDKAGDLVALGEAPLDTWILQEFR